MCYTFIIPSCNIQSLVPFVCILFIQRFYYFLNDCKESQRTSEKAANKTAGKCQAIKINENQCSSERSLM